MRPRRRKLSDNGLMILLLFLLGVIVVLERIIVMRNSQPPALSSRSDEADGASALYTWVTRLGYDTAERRLATFAVPEDTGLIFLLEPTSIP